MTRMTAKNALPAAPSKSALLQQGNGSAGYQALKSPCMCLPFFHVNERRREGSTPCDVSELSVCFPAEQCKNGSEQAVESKHSPHPRLPLIQSHVAQTMLLERGQCICCHSDRCVSKSTKRFRIPYFRRQGKVLPRKFSGQVRCHQACPCTHVLLTICERPLTCPGYKVAGSEMSALPMHAKIYLHHPHMWCCCTC